MKRIYSPLDFDLVYPTPLHKLVSLLQSAPAKERKELCDEWLEVCPYFAIEYRPAYVAEKEGHA